MNRITFAPTLALTLATSASLPAQAHEGDIGLAVVNGQLVTGIVELDAAASQWITPGQRVFAGELDAFGFAPDPGFFSGPLGNAAGPVTIPAAANLNFNLSGPLLAWTGAGLGGATARLRIEFASGVLNATTPTGPGTVPGFGLPTGPTGAFDEHWDFYLTGPSGTVGTVAAPGVYVAQVDLFLTGSTASTIAPAAPIWFVFNFNASEDDHDAAITWVEGNLVPSPAAACAFMLAGLAVTRRRRPVQGAVKGSWGRLPLDP